MEEIKGMRQQERKKMRKSAIARVCIIAALILIVQSFAFLKMNAYAAEATVTYKGEEILTTGAILKKYDFSTVRGSQTIHTNANVIEVALNNPMVKLDVMTGVNGEFTTKQSVRGMATETGAVGGINADFFNTQAEGVPEGPEIMNGKLMATPPFLPGLYSFALTKDNKPVIDLFTFQGAVYTQDGASFNLGGVNKSYYWFEPSGQHSMIDSMFLYTDAWGQEDRANDGVTSPTEVLVQNGIIKQIVQDDIIRMVPPKDGFILRAAGKAADFVMAHMKVGEKLSAPYNLVAQDPSITYDTKNFKTMVGGHTILVDQGKASAYSRDVADLGGYRSRTAIGYSKDEKYVYLITADKSGSSMGLSISELQQLMVKIGCWKGMLLDGGGSTQMVARPLGETGVKLINQTENGGTYERPVVNGIGVYSTAPKGEALGMKIVGETMLLMNEKAAYQVKGYDIYYNPIASGEVKAGWTASGLGTFADNVFTPTQKGSATLTAVSGQAKQTLNVKVAGKQDIESMQIQASNTVLAKGSDIKLSVKVKLKNGTERVVPGDSFQWEAKGFQGQVTGDTLHVTETGTAGGQLIARYDGFGAILPMNTGFTKLFADFDGTTVPISFTATPNDVKGSATIVPGLQGLPATNKAVQLSYDMTLGSGTKAAYIKFGDTNGLAVEGSPQSINLNVLGDKSLNWLRAEVQDAKGETKLVDLARYIDWTGWKAISADLTQYNLTYPIKLKRIYAANIAQGQDERAAIGTIGIDDITFQYKNGTTDPAKNQIKLIINNPIVTVNGKQVSLAPSPAPYINAGNTMVPLRFVTEALGGEVEWNNDERKVIIRRGNQLAELWLDQVNLNAGGKWVTAEVPPVLKGETTMVPIRIISENLGWKVSWDQSTYTATLE